MGGNQYGMNMNMKRIQYRVFMNMKRVEYMAFMNGDDLSTGCL
jgi:hypothetical protein